MESGRVTTGTSAHISQQKIWEAVREERDLALFEYIHIFNCGLCRRFLDVCVHSRTFEDAMKTFSELDICDTAA
jgi:hypothetical protein